MDFEVNKLAFLYGDSEYFQWFARKTKENLKNVIKWKRLRRGKPDIEAIWDEQKHDLDENALRNLQFGIITRAFLFHLKWPIEYPIFDINVFKAMKRINGEIKENKKIYIKNITDYEEYRYFFEKYFKANEEEILKANLPIFPGIYNKEIIKRRVLDRALWEFGRM